MDMEMLLLSIISATWICYFCVRRYYQIRD